MSKLLIATHNPGKIRELQDLLSGLGVDLITPQALGLDLELEEDGSTYLENATKKAIGYAKYSNQARMPFQLHLLYLSDHRRS